jgi:hypothetical protein
MNLAIDPIEPADLPDSPTGPPAGGAAGGVAASWRENGGTVSIWSFSGSRPCRAVTIPTV